MKLDQSSISNTEVKNALGVYLTVLPQLCVLYSIEWQNNHEFHKKK